ASPLRASRATFAPLRANSRAAALPTPALAPVTTTTLVLRPGSICIGLTSRTRIRSPGSATRTQPQTWRCRRNGDCGAPDAALPLGTCQVARAEQLTAAHDLR